MKSRTRLRSRQPQISGRDNVGAANTLLAARPSRKMDHRISPTAAERPKKVFVVGVGMTK